VESADGTGKDSTSPDSDPPGPTATGGNLPALPAPLREALKQPGVPPEVLQMTVAAFAASYSGPLPPAEQIRAYEDVLPGSADRILRMAERQQEHRQELESVTVREAANRSWWGLRLGFTITVLVVAVGAAGILTGRSLAGFGVILADLAVLAGVFAYGRDQQRKERVEKQRETSARPPLPKAERPSRNEH
jgi:uncharacterized membrane protein